MSTYILLTFFFDFFFLTSETLCVYKKRVQGRSQKKKSKEIYNVRHVESVGSDVFNHLLVRVVKMCQKRYVYGKETYIEDVKRDLLLVRERETCRYQKKLTYVKRDKYMEKRPIVRFKKDLLLERERQTYMYKKKLTYIERNKYMEMRPIVRISTETCILERERQT